MSILWFIVHSIFFFIRRPLLCASSSFDPSVLQSVHILITHNLFHSCFCLVGGWSEEEAFKKALSTWPEGVRPVVHWSESQDGRRPSAHSDFVTGPLTLYGLDDKVDVMIEAKAKELALLRLRDPTYVPGAAALALVYAGG